MSITATLKANYAALTLDRAEASRDAYGSQADVRHLPGKHTAAKFTDGLVIAPALAAPTEAEALRNEAENIRAAAHAQANSLKTAAATISTIPVVGPAIAAILAAIAAVITMIAQTSASGLEKRAAAKEQEAAAATSLGHVGTRHKITDP